MALLIDSGSRTTGPTMEMKVKVAGVELPVNKTGQLIRLLEHYRFMIHFMAKTLLKDEMIKSRLEAAAEKFNIDLERCDTRWRELISSSAVLQTFYIDVAKYYENKEASVYVEFDEIELPNTSKAAVTVSDTIDSTDSTETIVATEATVANKDVSATIIGDDNSITMFDDGDTFDDEILPSPQLPLSPPAKVINKRLRSENDQETNSTPVKQIKKALKSNSNDCENKKNEDNEIDISNVSNNRTGTSVSESTTYPCPVKPCTVVSVNQVVLRRHIRKAHPPLLTTCIRCNRAFDVRQTLLRHISGVHRNLSDEEKMGLYLIPQDFERYNLPPKEKWIRKQGSAKQILEMSIDEIPLFDYRCQIAGCKFKTYKLEELAKHEEISHEMVYACQHVGCYRSFEDQKSLDSHINEFHPLNVPGFSCPIANCIAHFNLIAGLKKHMRKLHPKEYTTCQRCNQAFSNRESLTKHVKYIHKDLSEEERQDLLLIPAGNGEWVDSVHHCALEGCDLTFETKDELDVHLKERHPDMYVTCRFCHKVSTTVQQLKYHIMYMHEEGEYYCPEEGCNFVGRFRKELKTHRFRNHKPIVKCKVDGCDETFPESNLNRHMLECHQVKKYQCTWPDCEMTFMKQFHLKRHIRAHMNFKRFLCKWPDCSYASEQKATVMTHVRVCHLKLPRTQREQKEKNISFYPNTQNPYDWIEVLPEDVIV